MANQVKISNTDNNVTVTQETTQIVTVAAQGPQGPAGPAGPQGPAGDTINTGSFVTTSSFNTFTSSIQTEVNTLTAATSSYILNSQTGSFATTGSNVFIGDQTITGSLLISGSSTLTNIGPAIFSGSINITEGITGSFLGTGSYALEALSASYAISASHEIIKEVSSSYADTASIGLNNFETISYNNSTFNITGIRSNGGQQNAAITNVPSASYSDTASYVNPLEQNVIITGSVDVKSGNVNIGSNSYFFQGTSTGGTNVSLIGVNSQDEIYIGNQGITNVIADDTNIEGDTQITGSLLVSGSGTISGSLNVTSSFTASGLNYPTVDGIDGSVIVSDGLGNLSMGHGERLVIQVRNNESFTITAGTPLHAVGSVGGSTRVLVVTASADSSNTDTMPAFGIASTDLTPTGDTKDGFAITTGIFPDYNITLAPGSITVEEGQVLYVGQNGGLTNVKPDTNDQNLIQNVGIVLKTNGTLVQNLQVSAINRTNDVPNLNQGNIFFGSGSNYAKIHISGALDQTIINNITASGNISASGNFIGNEITGSKLAIGSPIPGAAGYNGLTSKFNGGAFFNITEESDSVFGIHDSPDGADILRIDSDPDHFLIDPTNNGYKVGIGTPTPPEKLTVQGNISASGQIIANNGTFTLQGITIGGNHTIDYNAPNIRIKNTGLEIAAGPLTASIVSASGDITGNTGSFNRIYIPQSGLTEAIIDFNGGSKIGGNAQAGTDLLLSANDDMYFGAGDDVVFYSASLPDNDIPSAGAQWLNFNKGARTLTFGPAANEFIFNGNVSASGNISASGQIIGDVVDTSFENFLNFEAATSYTYIAPFPLTVTFTGSSTSSMEVVGFVTASANTDTFSVQQGLPITLNRFDKLKITPSSSGLFTFSGSRTI